MAVLTISDSSFVGMRKDLSGPAVRDRLLVQGWEAPLLEVLPDEQNLIAEKLAALADSGEYDVIWTTGGTGPSPRDVTPEATKSVIQRDFPGIPERMRSEGAKITPFAALSRAAAGIRGETLIVNLPGSPKGAVESMDAILLLIPGIVDLMRPGRAPQLSPPGGHPKH